MCVPLQTELMRSTKFDGFLKAALVNLLLDSKLRLFDLTTKGLES